MNHPIVPPSRKRIGQWLLLLVLLLVLLCVATILALPWLVNRPASMAALLQQVEARTGHRISFEQSHVEIFPSPRVTLMQPRLYAATSPDPLLFAERVEIALPWLPLLEGSLVVKDLVIDRPRVTLRRSPNGNWAPGNEHSPGSDSEPTPPFALFQVVRNLLVVQGMVTLVDESASPSASLNIIVTQAALSSEMLGRRAKLHLSGELPQAGARRSSGKGPSRNRATKMEYRQKGICDSIS